MLKEHKNPTPAKEKNYAFDLEEGDVASIEFPDFGDTNNSVLVYVFKHNKRLNMVALDRMKCFWSGIEDNSLSVIRVLEPGENIEVS